MILFLNLPKSDVECLRPESSQLFVRRASKAAIKRLFTDRHRYARQRSLFTEQYRWPRYKSSF